MRLNSTPISKQVWRQINRSSYLFFTPLTSLCRLLLKETNSSSTEILKTALPCRLQLKVLLDSLEAKTMKLFTSIIFTHCKESLASVCPQNMTHKNKMIFQGQTDSRPLRGAPLRCMQPLLGRTDTSRLFSVGGGGAPLQLNLLVWGLCSGGIFSHWP